jgi:hypothetical protein
MQWHEVALQCPKCTQCQCTSQHQQQVQQCVQGTYCGGWRRCACLDARTRGFAVGALASTTCNNFIPDLLFLSEVSCPFLVAGAPCARPYLGKWALRACLHLPEARVSATPWPSPAPCRTPQPPPCPLHFLATPGTGPARSPQPAARVPPRFPSAAAVLVNAPPPPLVLFVLGISSPHFYYSTGEVAKRFFYTLMRIVACC